MHLCFTLLRFHDASRLGSIITRCRPRCRGITLKLGELLLQGLLLCGHGLRVLSVQLTLDIVYGCMHLHIHHVQPLLLIRIQRLHTCLLYTSPSPRDRTRSRMPSSA
eukprot:TRINITY_DN10203_c0_g1_i1.p1 TRINITY_DN10203_c0_g1~~TRINITY_DN10203_c0_g1_i1.p1  ORF type:complete len:107 (-),score=27.40 TRINITY_DN10203_c0_g1_i1:134-454(-)